MAGNKTTALERLIPATTVRMPDGEAIRVPNGKVENQTANMLVAAQMRDLIEKSLAKFRAMEDPLTPKEARDMVEAIRALAEVSAKIYEPEDATIEKAADQKVETPDVSFDSLKAPIEVKAEEKK